MMTRRRSTGADRRRLGDRKHHRPWNHHHRSYITSNRLLSLSLNVLGKKKWGLRVQPFKIPQVKPIPLSIHPAFDPNPSCEAHNFAGLLNGGPIPLRRKPLRARPAIQVLDCHPYVGLTNFFFYGLFKGWSQWVLPSFFKKLVFPSFLCGAI